MGNQVGGGGWRSLWLGGVRTEERLFLVGLDAAGKTSLLYRFQLGETVGVIPTIGFNVERFRHGDIAFTAWEVGGGHQIRALWHHYYEGTDAYVFVVDAADRRRLHEAKAALQTLRESTLVQPKPLLVLANKQDLPGAMSAEEIAVELELHKLATSAVAVVPAVVTQGTGLYEALEWLTLQVTGRPAKHDG